MFRLRTLGAALLEGPEGTPASGAGQRRRIALLVLLATSRQGISRDRLVGLLWPESPEDRARHALAQLLYTLRRDLGGEVASGTATLLLDRTRVGSDVDEMEAALEEGDLERAVELYRGPFLDGFYLSGCPDFERWVEEERARIGHRIEDAFDRLARGAHEAADPAAEARWLTRRSLLTPLDARVASSLIRALAASGNLTGALQYARQHEARVREELGCGPDPAVVALVQELESAAPPGAAPRRVRAPRREPVAEGPPPSPSPPVDVASSDPEREDRRTAAALRRIAAAAVGLLVIAGLAAIAMSLVAPQTGEARGWALIADVENATGDPVFDRTVPVALAASLAQSRTVWVVPPARIQTALARMRRAGADSVLDESLAREIARREGVAVVLVPSVVGVDSSYEIGVRLVDPTTGGILDATTVRAARRADVIDALDRLGRQVRRRLGEPFLYVAGHTVPLPWVTTHSLEALELYAEGSRAFEANRLGDAESEWKGAVAIDSTFASALASLGAYYYWVNRPTEGDVWFTRALAHIGSLPERDQVLVRARADGWRGNRASSIHLLQVYLDGHPDDIDVLGMLAYDLTRTKRSEEAAAVLERLVALDSTNHVTLINLATAERQLRRYPQALAHYRRAFALMPSLETANNNLNLEYGSAFVSAGQTDSAAAVFARMLDGNALTRARGLRSLAFLDMYGGGYAAACAHLRDALSLLPPATAAVSIVRDRLLLAGALELRGDPAAAGAQIDSAWTLTNAIDAEPTILYWVGKALARTGDAERAAGLRVALRSRVHEGSATDLAASEGLEGEVLVARHRATEAVPHLEAALRADSSNVTLESLANALAMAGQLGRADTLYRTLAETPSFGWEGQEPWHVALYRAGQLEERLGQTAAAIEAYEGFLELWREADPTLPAVADARARAVHLRAAAGAR